MDSNSIMNKTSIKAVYLLVFLMSLLTISSWNMRGWGTGEPFLHSLLENTDIMCIQEHMLYPCETYRIDNSHTLFSAISTCSSKLDNQNCGKYIGNGGVSIMFRTGMKVSELKISSDRICGIKLQLNKQDIYVVCVYMPQSGCTTASFKVVVEELNRVVLDYQRRGSIVIMGDINAKFSKATGPRGGAVTSKNGALMSNFVKHLGLQIIDLQSTTIGPRYTYTSHWGTTSYLDHCLISSDIIKHVIRCEVKEEQVENLSDHLPLSLILDVKEDISTNVGKHRSISRKVAWDKASQEEIKERYQDPLDLAIKESDILKDMTELRERCITDKNQIDVAVDELTNMMVKVSDNLPKRQFRRHIKPYWTMELTKLSKTEKAARARWIEANKPRDKDNLLHVDYKNAKRQFQKRLRQAKKSFELEQHMEIVEQDEISQKYFWYLVNKARKPQASNNITPIKFPNGVTASEPKTLAEQWRLYFQKLSTPVDLPEYDHNFKETIGERLNEMSQSTFTNLDKFLKIPISREEHTLAIKQLKRGKAAGHDCVVAEHVQYASQSVQQLTLAIMNAIIDQEHIPTNFRYGLCIPLHKGGGKVKDDPDNFRKITLLPLFCKMFETILLNRSDQHLTEDNKLGELQGDAHRGASCLHTSLLLKEVIQHRVEEQGVAHVVFLDARKAFDCIWTDALFVKLYESGVNGKLWRLLKSWYSDLQCHVRIGDIISDGFKVKIGVFQGGKWSGRLFQVFYSELLKMLSRTLKGCNIYELRAVSPTHADDIAIIAPFTTTLQDLLKIVERFSAKWRIQFNPSKCFYMVFSKEQISGPNPQITLNGKHLEQVDYTKHLGVGIGPVETVLQEMIKKGKQAFSGILSLGRGIGGTNPAVASKLYWSTVVTSMLYGVQVQCLTEYALDLLEQEHRAFGKRIQCLPVTTSNPAAYRLLGWKSVRAYCDLSVLTFFYKTLHMDASCIFRKLVTRRAIHILMSRSEMGGPTAYFLKTCCKYKMLEYVTDYIDTGEGMSCEEWKQLCKSRISEREECLYIVDLCMAEKLVNMHNLQAGMHQWWRVCKQFPQSLHACRLMVKLLVGEEPFAWNTGRYIKPRSIQHRMCAVCKSGALETTKHFLYECSSLTESRVDFVETIREVCSDSETIIVRRDSKIVVSGLLYVGTDYRAKLEMVARAIYKMYVHRQYLVKSMNN